MQSTRRHILDILREQGEATVEEIVAQLQTRRGKDITAVTVRHHINLLQQEQLLTAPQLRRRSTPGRPQYVYHLTSKGRELFPNNYEHLAANLIQQMERSLPPETVNVIFEGVIESMAANAGIGDVPLKQRLTRAVAYLNEHGYNASCETCSEGYMLFTRNCPYHGIAETTGTLCNMDMRLVATLIGVVPRLVSRVTDGDSVCSYLIPE
jgi:DeoR family transcriptional regulator, suf operon transcriptional repressor